MVDHIYNMFVMVPSFMVNQLFLSPSNISIMLGERDPLRL